MFFPQFALRKRPPPAGAKIAKIGKRGFEGQKTPVFQHPRHSHRPLNGLFRGAVFRHVGGALKQPIKQPTEMPTSTMALMGRFPSLMGRFLTLMGRFTDFVLRGRFTS